ncbi:MAG: hypothetical protein O2840_04470 [bacterium]|nr:hypothetical protein [bacterium]
MVTHEGLSQPSHGFEHLFSQLASFFREKLSRLFLGLPNGAQSERTIYPEVDSFPPWLVGKSSSQPLFQLAEDTPQIPVDQPTQTLPASEFNKAESNGKGSREEIFLDFLDFLVLELKNSVVTLWTEEVLKDFLRSRVASIAFSTQNFSQEDRMDRIATTIVNFLGEDQFYVSNLLKVVGQECLLAWREEQRSHSRNSPSEH